MRGIRSESPFEVLHYLPSPTGLRLFLDAAEQSGGDPRLGAEARRAVEEFQRLLDEIPGGRSALDALMSERVIEVRRRGEHNAKQAVSKAMGYLLGFHCETISSAIILQPSGNGDAVDGIDLGLRTNLRRLRPSAPIAVFSVNVALAKRGGPGPWLEALGGGDVAKDPLSVFVPAFCDPSLPPVEAVPQEEHTVFAVADAAASVDRPVTLASALVVRGAWKRYRTGPALEEGRSYLLHYPCRLLVRDLYLRDDLYVGAEPEIRLEFPNPVGPPRPRTDGKPTPLNTLDLSAPVEQLGSGLARAAARGIPGHDRLVAHAFAQAGWDPARFRGYRTRIRYPVPLVAMSWWVPLGEDPEAARVQGAEAARAGSRSRRSAST